MRVEISSLVREAGATTVYITHDQAEAFALADQVGVLEKGCLVHFGPPEQIYTQPATPFVARFTGLAGELAVHVRGVVASSAAAAVATTVGLEVTGPALLRPARGRAAAPLTGAAILLIRPTGVQLVGTNLDEHHRHRRRCGIPRPWLRVRH
jgi:iron(III) transport system ATP-binding protein